MRSVFDWEFFLTKLFILLLVSSGSVQNFKVIFFQFKFDVVFFDFADNYSYFSMWYTKQYSVMKVREQENDFSV